MKTVVRVKIDNEVWERENKNGVRSGIMKRDFDFVNKVVIALKEVLEQAESELDSLTPQ